MLRALSRPATRMMERWLPDAFIFVIVLTLIAAIAVGPPLLQRTVSYR